MEQNSEDSQATKRSVEIHSGEVERARVSSAQAARKAKLFCGISFIKDKFILKILTSFYYIDKCPCKSSLCEKLT